MEIEIVHQFTTLNEYINKERIPKMGSIIANNIKQKETNLVMREALTYGYKAEEKKYDIEFHWFMKNLRKDPDNISFAQKFILDGLVKANVLKSDTCKYINSLSHYFEKADDWGVTIKLKESE